MAAALAALEPGTPQHVIGAASTEAGVTSPPTAVTKRPWMLAAALPASCW